MRRRIRRIRRRRRRNGRRSSRLRFAMDKVRPGRRIRRFGRMLSAFAERKVASTTTQQNINLNGVILQLPTISQGTTQSSRIGRKIFIRYVVYHGFIDQNTVVSALNRVIAYTPKSSAYLGLGDLPTTNYVQPIDLDKHNVIFDKLIPMARGLDNLAAGVNPNVGAALTIKPFRYRFKIFKSCVFNSDTELSIELPRIFFWNQEAAGAPDVYVSYTSYITYTDS